MNRLIIDFENEADKERLLRLLAEYEEDGEFEDCFNVQTVD